LAHFERGTLRIEGEDHLAVLESGRPVIILSAHLGSPELAVQALLARGHSFVALVEPVQPAAYARLLRRLRGAAGGTYVEAGPAGIRTCLRHLRAGGIVALVGDRDIQRNGICASLAGRAVRLPAGPFELAQRTGADILPVLSRRIGPNRLAVLVEPPFAIHCSGAAGVQEGVRRWAALLDQHLGAAPGQWPVTEDFFRVHACG
jgi:KDO2-lipid IV(A) lauroyltransferase